MLNAASPKQQQNSFILRVQHQCTLLTSADYEDKGTAHYRRSRHRFSFPACLNRCRVKYVNIFVSIWLPDD